jgi:hypothetical protein
VLREEHRLRVFENRVLRRIFGPRRDKVTGGWRKLHNVELHNSYSSPNIIRVIKSRRMRWERREVCTKFWLESLKGRDLSEVLGADGRNINMDLREVGLEGVEWIHLAQDRDLWWALVSMVMNIWVP